MAYHLTHPDSGLEIERDKDDVPMYLSQGWETKAGATPVEVDDKPVVTVLAEVDPKN